MELLFATNNGIKLIYKLSFLLLRLRRAKGQSFKVKVDIEHRPSNNDNHDVDDDDELTTSSPLRPPEQVVDVVSADVEPHLRADWDFVDIAFATIPRNRHSRDDERREADEADGLMPHVDPLRRGEEATVDRRTFK